MTDATPHDLLRRATAHDGARPLLTYLDEQSGERTEVSVTTFDNWVAKTANLLVDGLAVEPGARVRLLLPLHWQTAVWAAACWAAGCVAVVGDDAGPAAGDATADVVVLPATRPDEAGSALAAGAEVVVMALRPMAMPGPGVVPGATDYDVEIRSYGDRFSPYDAPTAQSPALDLHGVPGGVLDAGALVAAAGRVRDEWAAPQRILTAAPPGSLHGLLATTLVPLLSGGSAVLVRDAATLPVERLAHIAATERIDAALGLAGPLPTGVRELATDH